jgi:hypothetical protein
MTLVGIAGLLLGLAAVFVADLRWSRQRISVFALLFVLHAVASVGYYEFAKLGSDAQFYYNDPLQIYGRETGLSTIFTVNMVQFLRENFGGTFFDYFMLFQSLGFWGIVYLIKAVQEIHEELELAIHPWTYLPFFLPGIHFWTGAIGKDAPLFLGVALSVWAAMRLNRRYIAFGIAVGIMLLFRAHIALIALMALAAAALFEQRVKLWVKGILLAGVFGVTVITATSMDTTYQIDMSNADSVADFLEARSSVGEESGADLSLVNSSLPTKILSLWLRPFFFDAEGFMAYIASLENVLLLLIMMYLVINFRESVRITKKVMYLRFSFIFFVVLTLLLAMVSFNIGLGLRQKMMAMPCLLILFASIVAVRSAKEGQRQAVAPPGDLHGPTPSARLARSRT